MGTPAAGRTAVVGAGVGAAGALVGRGLLLVGALAEQWGVGPGEGVGKTVWAEWGLAVAPCDAVPLIGAEK